MRILLVHTRYRQRGGEDQVVETEGAALAAAGHAVEYHYVENPTGARQAVAGLARSSWNRSAARDVTDHASRFRADVVHVHNTWFSLSPAVFPALRKAGFPAVATIHNYRFACVNALFYRDGEICEDCSGRGPWRGVLHACYRESRVQSAAVAVTISSQRRVWGEVDAVVALTRFAADRLVLAGVPSDRIVVKPNFVADPGPRRLPPSASGQVLFVGRLTLEKGVTDVLEAWRNSEAAQHLTLTVVGDGPLRAEVEEVAGPNVKVLGWCPSDQVRELMLTARALVFPSRWYEGLPLTLVEAMASGLPTVVPDHGAMAEVAGAGGVVFRHGGSPSLAGVLSGLTDDSAMDKLGSASRLEYQDRFSPDKGVSDLEAMYGRLVAESGRLA